MLRSTIIAAAIALAAAAGTAQAEGYPRLSGAGDNAVLEYGGALPGSVVGGGQATIAGSGDNRTTTYGSVNAMPGRVGRVEGAGINAELVYEPERPAAAVPAGFARRNLLPGGTRG